MSKAFGTITIGSCPNGHKTDVIVAGNARTGDAHGTCSTCGVDVPVFATPTLIPQGSRINSIKVTKAKKEIPN